MKVENSSALVTGANRIQADLEEVLADERTRLVKQGLSAANAIHLPARAA